MRQALTAPPTANEPDGIPAPRACPDCNGAGWYLEAVPYGHPNFGTPLPCRCTRADQADRRRRREREILSRLDTDLGALAACTFASFDPARGAAAPARRKLADALAEARRYATERRGWLYLHGPCGTGKSHLAAAIAHAAVAAGLRVSYASVPALLRFVKAGFGDRSSDDRLLALQLVDLLILDDIGAEYHSKVGDWSDQVLFELINERYLYDRATVLTSNLAPDELEPRIGSRIRGRSRVVHVLSNDQRGAS